MTVHKRPLAVRNWRRLIMSIKEQVERDRLSIVAAGVAFYALLAVFPALAALVALYGLVFDVDQVARQLSTLQGLLPEQALEIVLKELQGLTQTNKGALGWGAVGGLLLTLWSASKGIRTLMEALNIAYDQRESRGFIRRNALVLLLTLGAIVGAGIAIATVVFVPAIIRFIGLEPLLKDVISYARWPILAAAMAAGIAVMYRYGPDRAHPRWPLVAWGAVVATGLWLTGSALFSLYVSNFGNFDRTYGSIAAIVILLMWFLLSAYAVLIGAEVSAELERDAAEAGA